MKKKELKVRDFGRIFRFFLGDIIFKGSFYSSWVGRLFLFLRVFRVFGVFEFFGKLVTFVVV